MDEFLSDLRNTNVGDCMKLRRRAADVIEALMAEVAIPDDINKPDVTARLFAVVCAESGSVESVATINGLTYQGRPLGDWKVVARQIGSAPATSETPISQQTEHEN